MTYQVEVIAESPTIKVSTRCHWDEKTQSLYYVNFDGQMLRYDFNEKKVYTATIDNEPIVAFILPIENKTNEFAIGLGRRVGIVTWDGKSPKGTLGEIVFEVDQNKPENKFNNAKADPVGRFVGGTMRDETLGDIFKVAAGGLYKYVNGEGVRTLVKNVHISNGLAWDEKRNKLYYIDSCKFDVKEYDWDRSTGDISHERVVIDFSKNGEHPGFIPDGLTIDTDGNIYVTTFGGSTIFKVDPKNGEILLEIQLPVKQVTAACFGGPGLDILYVTTAALPETKKILDIANTTPHALSGRLFKVTGLGVKGFAGTKVRL